jgi:hypothetical protein
MNKHTSKRLSRRRNKRRTKKNKKLALIKKGGDIMYARLPETKDIGTAKNFICSDDNVCLAFGESSEQIKALFDGFVRFNFATRVLKRIGKPSVNGFVFEIKNETRGYTAYSVLKSAQDYSSDNLMYEYVVGQYVNKLNKLYPCFLETYGLFKYKNENQWEIFKNTKEIINLHALQAGLTQQPINYAKGCRKSKYLAILIQHLLNPITLDELSTDQTFIKDELLWALFQLYIPLAKLMNNFTHYDLHLGNILMYEPVKGKYIEYHYHLPPVVGEFPEVSRKTRTSQTAYAASMKPDIISFKSSYMLKIIDYGRSYFNDEESHLNSKQVYDEICQINKCNTRNDKCGASFGFSWLEDDSHDPAGNFYISAQHKNISHDLLPLERIYQNNTKENPNNLPPDLFDLIKKVIYNDYFGTPEDLTAGYPANINNVQDAADFIAEWVKKPEYQARNNAANRTKGKLGDLHIFMDGITPMEFVPTP